MPVGRKRGNFVRDSAPVARIGCPEPSAASYGAGAILGVRRVPLVWVLEPGQAMEPVERDPIAARGSRAVEGFLPWREESVEAYPRRSAWR